jgi:hypothetical protein
VNFDHVALVRIAAEAAAIVSDRSQSGNVTGQGACSTQCGGVNRHGAAIVTGSGVFFSAKDWGWTDDRPKKTPDPLKL